MNNKVYEVKLDMKRATSTRGEWVVVEGDNGNKIEITLTDDGAPVNLSNCRALAVFGKPDGTTVEQDTEGNGLTVSGDDHNIITIELYAGSFSPGPMKCEIQVYSGENYGTLITSAQFTFKCRRGIMNSDTVQSVPEYPILLSATAAAEEATAEALAAAATARSSVQSDWAEADAENPRYIQHKPTAFTPSAHASTHANGGADALTPANIGAAAADHTHTPASIGAESARLQFTNTVVPTAAFATNAREDGQNKFNGLLEQGFYDRTTGEKAVSNNCMRAIDFIEAVAESTYTLTTNTEVTLESVSVLFWNEDTYLSYTSSITIPFTFTAPIGTTKMSFYLYKSNGLPTNGVNWCCLRKQTAGMNGYSPYIDAEFKCTIPLTGVLASMTPEVVLGVAEAIGGTFAPISECYTGGVYLYASEAPVAAITIPTITCWKGVA